MVRDLPFPPITYLGILTPRLHVCQAPQTELPLFSLDFSVISHED